MRGANQLIRALIKFGTVIGGLLCSSTAFSMDDYQPLTAEKMQTLLPGNTIKGEYRFLRERTKTFNFRESHYANGTTDYIEGPVRENGVWYTLGETKICYKYPDNPAMRISCFWVYENVESKSKCYYGYGIQGMTLKGPRNFDDWTARWVIEGTGGSCNEPVS